MPYLVFMQKFLVLLLVVVTTTLGQAQAQRLSGKVTAVNDPNGLPGVNVVIRGTSIGTITDIEGQFSIELSAGAILQFSFIGYKSQEFTYANQSNITIVLEEQAKELSEIIVVGYSSVQRRDITGAITTINADKLKGISFNGLDQALQGQVAGVQVTQSSGTPGGGVSVRIRGVTSISAGNTPLYVIDGIPVETGGLSARSFGGQNDNALSLINPNDIESYSILSDASAKSLYGSRASNGVLSSPPNVVKIRPQKSRWMFSAELSIRSKPLSY